MRVLTALTYYRPHWTGLTANAAAVAEGLAARGHEVTVLCTRHEAGLPRREHLASVEVLRAPVAGRLSRGTLAPGLVPAAVRLLGRHDVLHVHTPMLEVWPLVAAARRRGVPSVVTHQGDLVLPAGAANRAIERTVTAAMARGLRAATRASALSADYAAHSRFLAPVSHKLTAIAPPVDLPAPDPGAVARLRARLGLEGRPVVGFAGRFVEEKGFDRLLEAVPALAARVPDVHLVHAGAEMPYEDFRQRCRPLLERHADRMTDLGLLTDRRELAAFYAMCDVLAVPSRTDMWNAGQVEAMRCGTPVVVSDIPGAREPVRMTGMGRVVPEGDIAALAAALAAELASPSVPDGPPPFDPAAAIGAYEALLEGAR